MSGLIDLVFQDVRAGQLWIDDIKINSSFKPYFTEKDCVVVLSVHNGFVEYEEQGTAYIERKSHFKFTRTLYK